MPGAGDLIMWLYAAMAQKERELIRARTTAALADAKARGTVLGGTRVIGSRVAQTPLLRPACAGTGWSGQRIARRAFHIEIPL